MTIGCKIKILKRGSNSWWTPSMDKYIGRTGKVSRDYGNGIVELDFGDGGNFAFDLTEKGVVELK